VAPGVREGVKRAADSRAQAEGLVHDAGRQKPRRFRAFVAIVIVLVAIAAVVALAWNAELLGGVTAPDVTGWRAERAASDLEDLGFTVTQEDVLADGQAGFVISQSPTSGRLPEHSDITLRVSLARIMPDVVGKNSSEAQAAVEAQGVTCTIEEEISAETPGTVTASSVASGTQLSSGDAVNLTVARASKVPTLIGLSEADATAALAAEELQVKVTYVVATDATQVEGNVIASDLTAGTEAAPGTTVSLTVIRPQSAAELDAATKVVQAIYSCDPTQSNGSVIGAAIRPYLSTSVSAAYPSDHDLWYAVVKKGRTNSINSDALEQLTRTLVGEPTATSTGDLTVGVTFTVTWDWSRMGDSYAGVTSTDTRTVTVTFDSAGKVTAVDDPQSDVPLYEVVS
jgi:YD repeat-containing protein